jgi:uncharacterized protein (DUF433 family)
MVTGIHYNGQQHNKGIPMVHSTNNLITVDPDILSGTPVFTGTRVPVQSLIDHLKAGDGLEDFLAGFPSVRREQAIAFLEQAGNVLVEQAVDANSA